MPATPNQEQSVAAESVQTAGMRAMGLLASGRTWLVFLISVALLFQIGMFVAANWGQVLRDRPVTAEVAAPDAPTDETPAAPAGNFLQNLWPAQTWRRIVETGLPLAGLVAVACAVLLIPVTMMAVQVNLVSRLPAMSATISAFYWSLLTLVLMLPWGKMLGDVLSEKMSWVFYNARELDEALAALSDQSASPAQVWLRFLAWPILAMLAAMICGSRFGNAYWQIVGLAEMQAKTHADQPT